MQAKQYHSKVEPDRLDELRLEEHLQTLQKESKYYSNAEDTAIKKKLIDYYDQPPSSTHHSTMDRPNNSLLNQLQDAIQSYRPTFKDIPPRPKLEYLATNLEPEREEVATISQEESKSSNQLPQPMDPQRFDKFEPVRRARISRVDRQISALYKQNRNINLEYRTQKFMQLFMPKH